MKNKKKKKVVLTEKIVVGLAITTHKKVVMQAGKVKGIYVLKLPSTKKVEVEDTIETRDKLFEKACEKYLKGSNLEGKTLEWIDYVVDNIKFYICHIKFTDVSDLLTSNLGLYCYVENARAFAMNNRVSIPDIGSIQTTEAYREALIRLFLTEKEQKKIPRKQTGTNGAEKVIKVIKEKEEKKK